MKLLTVDVVGELVLAVGVSEDVAMVFHNAVDV